MLKIYKKSNYIEMKNNYLNASFVLSDYNVCNACNRYKKSKGMKYIPFEELRKQFFIDWKVKGFSYNIYYKCYKNKNWKENRKAIFGGC